MAAPRPEFRFAPTLAGLVLVVAAALAWANSFRGPFVFDDRPAILANPTLDHFGSALSPPRDGGTVAGRPLVNLSLALNRALGGTAVAGYHAFNLLVHLLAGLTLFALVRRTLLLSATTAEPARARATAIAFSAALLWLLHPLQTAAVTYTIQRAESLMALCFLVTLYGFVRSQPAHDLAGGDRGAAAWRIASVTACFAGMASKEVMVVAPLVVLLYDRTFVAGSFRTALRGRASYYAALALSWVLLGWLVATNSARAGTAGFGGAMAWSDYALTQCGAVVHYVRLAFWPRPLVFDYGTGVETSLAGVWPQALGLLAALVATVVALRRRPVLGFLCAAFFLILAPSSSVVPIATQTIAEHRVYLPLAALAIGVAWMLHAALSRGAGFVTFALAVSLGLATAQRNRDYRDALTLWADTAAKRSENPRAHNNLGIELARAGRPAEAIPHYEIALRAAPDDAELHNNLGNVLAAVGRDAEALPHFERSAALKPASAAAQLNLAHALLRAERPAEAAEHFSAAERLAPLNADAHTSFGVALLQSGRLPAALEHYRRALQLDPGFARAHYNLGLALARSGQLGAAAEALREAVRLEPANLGARVNLGNALLFSGRPAEAVTEYEAALRLKPDDPQIRANLARARAGVRP